MTTNVDAQVNGGAYVTSTPGAGAQTLERIPQRPRRSSTDARRPRGARGGQPRPTHADRRARALDLYPTSAAGESEVVKAAVSVPFRVLYPRAADGPRPNSSRCAPTRSPTSTGTRTTPTWSCGSRTSIDGYYDFEGTDWLNPPLFAHARTQEIDGRDYNSSTTARTSTWSGWRETAASSTGSPTRCWRNYERTDVRSQNRREHGLRLGSAPLLRAPRRRRVRR